MTETGSAESRLAEALAELRLRVLLLTVRRLGCPADAAAVRDIMRDMSDREVLAALGAAPEEPSEPGRDSRLRGFWQRLLLFWPFR